MNDDDAQAGTSGDAMLYDYLKHLTSLCLFSLAGVAALADKVHGRSAVSVVMALVVIGVAAFSSFFATGLIVEARFSGKPLTGKINLYRHASPLLLSVGLGMFLYLYVKSLTS
ncbi:hypothetical protein NF699_16715 [Sphingomonadaceae bacterium OTU29LAMAA1]|nr:hypothetical protein NF699_16715 [Sphingomonadaceae bacterium OTU29LAMAA1]